MKTVRRESRTMRADVPRVVRGSLASVGGNLEVSRTGAPDPLSSISGVAAADAEDGVQPSARSGGRSITGSGYAADPREDHEAQRNRAGQRAISITELEAREREMLDDAGILT